MQACLPACRLISGPSTILLVLSTVYMGCSSLVTATCAYVCICPYVCIYAHVPHDGTGPKVHGNRAQQHADLSQEHVVMNISITAGRAPYC